jgi:hypothetical protein
MWPFQRHQKCPQNPTVCTVCFTHLMAVKQVTALDSQKFPRQQSHVSAQQKVWLGNPTLLLRDFHGLARYRVALLLHALVEIGRYSEPALRLCMWAPSLHKLSSVWILQFPVFDFRFFFFSFFCSILSGLRLVGFSVVIWSPVVCPLLFPWRRPH